MLASHVLFIQKVLFTFQIFMVEIILDLGGSINVESQDLN